MTRKKRLPGGALSVLIAAQLVFSICAVARIAVGPSKFLNRSFIRVWAHKSPAVSLHDMGLDVFEICSYQRWRLGELLYINIAISFGMSSLPNHECSMPLT